MDSPSEKHKEPKKTEVELYKEAVWDFILEHCDITENGAFFVKFHTSHRRDFEKRISARVRGYHRKDARSDFTREQKQKDADARRAAHLSRKQAKRRKYKGRENVLPLAEQKKALAQLHQKKKKIEVMHTQPMQPLARWWYNTRQLWENLNRQKGKKEM